MRVGRVDAIFSMWTVPSFNGEPFYLAQYECPPPPLITLLITFPKMG